MSVDLPEKTTSPKVSAAGAAGALATLIAWAVFAVWDVEVPVEVAVAVASLLVTGAATLAGYLRRDPLRQPLVKGPPAGGGYVSVVGVVVLVLLILLVMWLI